MSPYTPILCFLYIVEWNEEHNIMCNIKDNFSLYYPLVYNHRQYR